MLERILRRALSYKHVDTELDLRANHIDAEQAKLIAEELILATDVRLNLDLGNNILGDEGTVALAGALLMSQSLKILWLTDNRIGEAGMAALAEVLEQDTSLQTLCVSRNPIGTVGLRLFANTIGLNTGLKSLLLNECSIDDEGARIIAVALQRNSTLKALSLEGNNIGDEGALVMLNVLKRHNTSLTRLLLEGKGDISSAILTEINNVVEANEAGTRSIHYPIDRPTRAPVTQPTIAPLPLGPPNTMPTTPPVPTTEVQRRKRARITLHAGARRFLAQRRYHAVRKSVVSFQSLWRARQAKRCFLMLQRQRSAAVRLQSRARRFAAVRHFRVLSMAAISVQQWWRKRLLFVKTQVTRKAAVRLQSMIRSTRARRTFLKLRASAVRLQRLVRRVVARQKRRKWMEAATLRQERLRLLDSKKASVSEAAFGLQPLETKEIALLPTPPRASPKPQDMVPLPPDANPAMPPAIEAQHSPLPTVKSIESPDSPCSVASHPSNIALATKEIALALPVRNLPTPAPAASSVMPTEIQLASVHERPFGLPKQRAELEFEIRRLSAVRDACLATSDRNQWLQGIAAEDAIRQMQNEISSGRYPTSEELQSKVDALINDIRQTAQSESLAAAMPLRDLLEQLEADLALEREAEERLRQAIHKDSELESITVGRRAVSAALLSTDPRDGIGAVPIEYLASITNDWRDEIGSGGFGVVFKGQDATSGIVVAVKKIPNDRLHEKERKQFKNEVEVCRQIEFRKVSMIVDFFLIFQILSVQGFISASPSEHCPNTGARRIGSRMLHGHGVCRWRLASLDPILRASEDQAIPQLATLRGPCSGLGPGVPSSAQYIPSGREARKYVSLGRLGKQSQDGSY
jgi:Protein kinase domain/Leucine Rich repeat